jgi:hypothetical protein
MSLSSFQSDLKAVFTAAAAVVAGEGVSAEQLAIAAALSGFEFMLELDETATAAQLDAQEHFFEEEISRKGFVAVISTPRAERIDLVAGRTAAGAAHLRVLCQVAFIENPGVNRMPSDAARPEVVPAAKRPLVVIRAAMQAALGAGYELPAQPLTAPEIDLEGLNLHGLLITGKDDVRAA